MAKLFPPGYQFKDSSGKPVAGGGVVFYTNKTTTLKNVFTDPALTSAATNSSTTVPKGQPLNAAGRFLQGDLYGSNTYTVVLFDSAGGTIWSRDDFNPSALTDLDGDTSITLDTDDQILFTVDSIEAMILGWQSVTDTGFLTLDPPAFTADTTENTHKVALLNTRAITTPTGTTPLVSSVYILEPNISKVGDIDVATTVYIKGAPTEGDANYALWIDAGAVRFDGVTTHGANVVSDTDSTDDLGTSSVRWANLYVDDIISTTSVTTNSLLANSDNAGAIGALLTAFSDLFLASGSVINFHAGDVTLTHSDNLLTIAGGDLAITSRNLVFSSGNGIDFSATSDAAGMTSELFDDYEEGTWTVLPADATSGGNTGGSSSEAGVYVKIGLEINLFFGINNITTAGLTAGNDLFLQGVPISASTVTATGSVRSSELTFAGGLTSEIAVGESAIRIAESATGTVVDYILVSEVSTGVTDINGQISYV